MVQIYTEFNKEEVLYVCKDLFPYFFFVSTGSTLESENISHSNTELIIRRTMTMFGYNYSLF